MSQDSYYVTKDGKAMCRCYDCRRVMSLKVGREFNIEVGESGKVVGVLCDECHARMQKVKAT